MKAQIWLGGVAVAALLAAAFPAMAQQSSGGSMEPKPMTHPMKPMHPVHRMLEHKKGEMKMEHAGTKKMEHPGMKEAGMAHHGRVTAAEAAADNAKSNDLNRQEVERIMKSGGMNGQMMTH